MLFRKVVLSPMAIPRPVLSFSRVRTFVVETPRFKAVNYGSPELHLGLQLHPFCPKKPNPFFFVAKGHLNVRLLPEEDARHMSLAVTTWARTAAVCLLHECKKGMRMNVMHEKGHVSRGR